MADVIMQSESFVLTDTDLKVAGSIVLLRNVSMVRAINQTQFGAARTSGALLLAGGVIAALLGAGYLQDRHYYWWAKAIVLLLSGIVGSWAGIRTLLKTEPTPPMFLTTITVNSGETLSIRFPDDHSRALFQSAMGVALANCAQTISNQLHVHPPPKS